MIRIAVLGAGALGCAIGGTLARAGHDVVLINRNADQVDAINEHGLMLVNGDGEQTVRLKAASSAVGLPPVELLIVLVKSFHTEQALRTALNLVGESTTALSLQNGLGHEEILAELVGREHVLAGKTYVGGVQLGRGRVLANTQGKETLVGELDGGLSTRVQRIAQAFSEAGLATTASTDIKAVMWDKLLVNVATGAVSSITRLPYGSLYQIPEIEQVALAAVQEAMDVARAAGVSLSCRTPREAWLKAAAGLSADFRTSMLQSLEKGSITEIDYINGAVVREGQRCGVPTPVNTTLVACIKGIEAALHRPSTQGTH